MNFQKFAIKMCIAASVSILLEGSSAFSQTADSPNAELFKLNEEKNRLIEADRNLTNFISQYTLLLTGFERAALSFQDALKRVESTVNTRSQGINEVSGFINDRIDLVMNPASKSLDINKIWSEYRSIRTQKNACDESVTTDAYIDVINSATGLRAYHSSLTSLIFGSRLAAEHRPILDQARKGLEMMANTMKQADAAVEGYKTAIDTPKVCELFRSFDVIVALASSAAEANEAAAEIDKINISQFLEDVAIASKVSQAVATARRMMTSYEASFISNLRGGYLQRSLATAENYQDIVTGIVKNPLESSLVSAADKADLSAKADQTRASIVREMDSSRIMQIEGRRNLLLTRGRNLYAAIGKVAKEPANPATDARKKELLDYAKASLGMTFPGRYLVPQTPTMEAELELDSKFERADQLLLSMGGK